VRHHLVQRIVRAYDEHKTRVTEQQMLLLAEAKHPDLAEMAEKGAAASLDEKPAATDAKQ
jgi:hypothetical protein